MIPTSKKVLTGEHGDATVDEVYQAVIEQRQRELPQ